MLHYCSVQESKSILCFTLHDNRLERVMRTFSKHAAAYLAFPGTGQTLEFGAQWLQASPAASK